MLESVWKNGHKFEDVKQYLVKRTCSLCRTASCKLMARCFADIALDPGFKSCFQWCEGHDVPVIIVSSGMKPIIEAVLTNLVGEKDAANIDIISNDVEVAADGAWKIKVRRRRDFYLLSN